MSSGYTVQEDEGLTRHQSVRVVRRESKDFLFSVFGGSLGRKEEATP